MKGRAYLILITLMLWAFSAHSQCSNYTITVGGGTWDGEISWNIDQGGVAIYAGIAESVVLCLDDGCYNFNMADSFGDGWNGATYTITNAIGVVVNTGNLDLATTGDGLFIGSDVVCLTAPPPPPPISV